MIKAPCKDCKERTVEPNCHMTCKRYHDFLEWVKLKKANREKLKRVYKPSKYL